MEVSLREGREGKRTDIVKFGKEKRPVVVGTLEGNWAFSGPVLDWITCFTVRDLMAPC